MVACAESHIDLCAGIHDPEGVRILSESFFRFGKGCRIQSLAILAQPVQCGIQAVILDPVTEQHIN